MALSVEKRKAYAEARWRRVCCVCKERTWRTARGGMDYMLKDEVWAAAGFTRTDLACLFCFEDTIGREVNEDDFSDAIVNHATVALMQRWRKRAEISMGAHIVNGKFQSDKYPTCPPGKVPLSVEDPTAQDLLWEYAQRRRVVDVEFADDLEMALRAAGYTP